MLISQVGRSSPVIRAIIIGIYIALVIGASTMVAPFMITATGSVSNEFDYERYSLYPKFFFSREDRYGKFLSEKYFRLPFPLFASAYGLSNEIGNFRTMGHIDNFTDRHFPLFRQIDDTERFRRVYEDYTAFMDQYGARNVLPLFFRWNTIDFQDWLREKYEGLAVAESGKNRDEWESYDLYKAGLRRYSEEWDETEFVAYDSVSYERELIFPYHNAKWLPPSTPRQADFIEFTMDLEAYQRVPVTERYLWALYLLDESVKVPELNRQTGKDYRSLFQVPVPDEDETNPRLRELRDGFVREYWPRRLVRLKPEVEPLFRAYAKEQFKTLAEFNRWHDTDYETWEELPFYDRFPESGAERGLWVDFTDTLEPDRMVRLSPERAWREFLREKYGTIEAVNQAYQWEKASFEEVLIPLPEVDLYDFAKNENRYFKKFLTFNFMEVIRFMAVRGYAVPNTIILVVLSILCALTVNPLAAYSLSRFRPRATYQILIFFLATMSFPPSVAMIPSFLLLRDFGLLNTFGALILPHMANGFSIFLLKGFFDSLPPELYEAATIDGAGEMTMFTRITIPLCKPILAYIALQAFIMAYGSFMWAFLVCQDEKMWTLMVWLYQFQMRFGSQPNMIMAAIILASGPTLFIFLFCQKIIMRGIIIPTMK